ncbi:MAG: SIMPL domain-containing protein, partial [Mucinivorans sp.]
LDRAVTVRGLCEIERPADKVIWPVVYTEVGDDLNQISSAIETKNKAIMAFLASSGIPTSDITSSAPSVVDQQANQYANEKSMYRYYATQVITVSSQHVDKVMELMAKQSEMMRQGIAITNQDYRFQTQFFFTKLDEVKPSMIEEATKNARASAQKFAEDSQSELGKIKRASQGQLTIEDRDANTPNIKTLRVVTTIEYRLED